MQSTGTPDALTPRGPLGVVDIAFVLLRRGATVFIPLTAILVAVPVVVSFAFTLLARRVGNAVIDSGGSWNVAIAAVDASLVVAAFAAAVLVIPTASVDVWAGSVPTFRSAFRTALAPARWAGATALFACAWSLVIVATVVDFDGRWFGLRVALFVVGVPVAAVLTLRWVRIGPVVAAEDVGVNAARRRAAALGRPFGTWRLAVSMCVAAFLAGLVMLALLLGAELLRNRLDVGIATTPELVLDKFIDAVTAWTALLVCGTVPFTAYVDGRVRTEGLDLTLLLAASSTKASAGAGR